MRVLRKGRRLDYAHTGRNPLACFVPDLRFTCLLLLVVE